MHVLTVITILFVPRESLCLAAGDYNLRVFVEPGQKPVANFTDRRGNFAEPNGVSHP
jgi:hypothetical protein